MLIKEVPIDPKAQLLNRRIPIPHNGLNILFSNKKRAISYSLHFVSLSVTSSILNFCSRQIFLMTQYVYSLFTNSNCRLVSTFDMFFPCKSSLQMQAQKLYSCLYRLNKLYSYHTIPINHEKMFEQMIKPWRKSWKRRRKRSCLHG